MSTTEKLTLANRRPERFTAGSVQAAYWYALLVDLFYEEPDKVESVLKTLECFRSFHFFEQGNTQAGIIEFERDLVVIYRGTDQLGDWLSANLRVTQQYDGFGSPGKVHIGFYNYALAVWRPLRAKLLELIGQEPRPVNFAGHSLGAAAVCYVSVDVPEEYVQGLYLFGSPRLGNALWTFSHPHKHRTYRYSYKGDIVTKLLALTWFGRWSHLGPCRLLGDESGELEKGIISQAKVAAINFSDRNKEDIYQKDLKEKYTQPRGFGRHSISYAYARTIGELAG